MKTKFNFLNGEEIEARTLYGIGSNYSKHAMEMGGVVPSEPVIFIKPAVALIGDNEKINIPDFSQNVHHELELIVIIGIDCSNIDRTEAHKYIAGYGVGLDITLRDIQNKAKTEGKPWAVCKGFRTSAPVSAIVPVSHLSDPLSNFEINLWVNGELRQTGLTAEMERPVDLLIEYLSKVFSLRRGDCIFTGTPEGVGRIISGDTLKAELRGYVSLNVSVE
ncbi:MAG: fumarylacetoacetate hydrolase family protein [Candidatus Kapabacteria bacterium]|nr:fumarylacetoacetate hydrolase family protein [Candidatus Kapabacteria bacterium]